MIRTPRHQTVAAYVALVLAATSTGGAAYAAAQVGAKNIKPDAVRSKHVKDGAIRTKDLANDAVTGDKVDEATLGQVPLALDAATLNGRPASTYAASSVYKREAATDAGTALGDGTNSKFQACDAGDILLAGGPASINATSTLLESFPTPGSTTSWSVRINTNGSADSFTVVVLCLDQS